MSREMKLFFTKAAGLLIALMVLFAAIWKVSDETKSTYMEAFSDKWDRLSNTSNPRIILVGGSNLAYGVDSKRLAEALNCDVVNMGLHANLGMDFMLDSISQKLKPGDVVVASIEYELFSDTHRPDGMLLATVVGMKPELVGVLTLNNYKDIAEGIVNSLQNRARALLCMEKQTSAPQRTGFNKYGDYVAHHGSRRDDKTKLHGNVFCEFSTGIGKRYRKLQLFADQCKSNGVAFHVTSPPTAECHMVLNQRGFKNVDESLRRNSPSTTPINLLSESTLPDGLFFDTVYHLNDAGAELRTTRLISDLQRVSTR
jgi:hypothetical protein